MWSRAVPTLAAVLAATLLAACAGAGDEPVATKEPTPRPEVTVTQEPQETPASTPAAQVGEELTEADDGRAVTMAVGQEVPLRLAGDWEWQEPELDPSGSAVVSLSPVDYLDDPGFQEWLVTASAAGTAGLVSRGEPACGDPAACPPRELRLVIEVTG